LVPDSGGFVYINSTLFPQAFAQDVIILLKLI
jgi:hypothetical protein